MNNKNEEVKKDRHLIMNATKRRMDSGMPSDPMVVKGCDQFGNLMAQVSKQCLRG